MSVRNVGKRNYVLKIVFDYRLIFILNVADFKPNINHYDKK